MSAHDDEDTEKEELLLVRLQNGTVTLDISVRVLKKLKIDLPQDLPLLGIYPKNSISYSRDTFSSVFSAVLFLIVRS